MIRLAAETDALEMQERLVHHTGILYSLHSLVTKTSFIMFDPETKAIIRAVRDGDAWYVGQMWGRANEFFPLIKAMVAEARSRGEGARNIRWDLSDRTALQGEVRTKLSPRTAVAAFGREHDELTFDEADVVLAVTP